MYRFFCLLSVLIPVGGIWAQTLTPERITTWNHAGLTTALEAPTNQVDITDFGADNTGTNSCNSAYAAAISSLNGTAGTIYFPQGEYYFTAAIAIPDSVFLKGESSETVLHFDLGGSGNLIVITGSTETIQLSLSANAIKGTDQVELANASSLQVGDVIRLFQFDEDYLYSSWAYGTVGQVAEIVAINGNTVTLADPLNHHYPLSRNPFVRKLNPRRGTGVECLKILREDASVGQTSNIYFNYAYNCVLRNVESENCNFTHCEVNSSAHIQVEGCYYHHAFAYGGGGQGYGQVFQLASSFCLAQNNVFEHLRHSMLIQAGANGNVFGYNYSTDPYWNESFYPTNSSGDAVLHGNYTYLNLFEGNTMQNMVVDASHESNGPFNTFLRNRGELYGFFSDSSTPTDSMNLIGNEITNTGFPLGMFSLNGNGHYSFGNNVYGTTNPANTSNVTVNSLYLDENDLPDFLSAETLPMIGYPLGMNEKVLAAETRFENSEPVNCQQTITDVSSKPQNKLLLRLNGDELQIDPSILPANLTVYSLDGKQLCRLALSSDRTSLMELPKNQLLLLQVVSSNGFSETVKLKR